MVNSWLYSCSFTNCSPGPGEFGPHQQSQHAGQQKEPERGDHIEIADHLVIGRGRPAVQGTSQPQAR